MDCRQAKAGQRVYGDKAGYGISDNVVRLADEAKLTNQLNHFTLNYLTNKVDASNELPID